MLIQTYETWAKKNDKKCRRFVGYGRTSSKRLFRITNRPSILRAAGFRLVTGGMMDDCSRRTDERGKLKTPRKAVADFLEDGDYSEALYYPDPFDACGVMVWAK